MNAYTEDLRRKIVLVFHSGMGKSQAAPTFSVSLSSVKRYAKLAEEGHSLTPKKSPGSLPKMDQGPSGSWWPTLRSVRPPRSHRGASTCIGSQASR